MRITWFGHAAFLIEAQGLRIILDPYRSPDSGGYRPIEEPADIVVVSHENDRYHSHLGQIVAPFDVVRALELGPSGQEVRGLRIEAIRVFENAEARDAARARRSEGSASPTGLMPPEEDEVTIVHFRAEGLHLVFLGDLGHPLDEPELAPLRGAEVVLVPAGGPPTIALDEAAALLDAIGPRLVLPMHYKTPGINLNIQPVERFLETQAGVPVDRPGETWIEVDLETLPVHRRIVILDHAR